LAGFGFVLKVMADPPQYSWCAWEPLREETAGAAAVDTPIYTGEDLLAYHLWFSGRHRLVAGEVNKIKGMDGVQEDTAYFLPRGFSGVRIMDLAELKEERFWLAIRGPNISESEPPLRNLLVKGYHIMDRREVTATGEKAMMILLQR
jgi:hypothetical protein